MKTTVRIACYCGVICLGVAQGAGPVAAPTKPFSQTLNPEQKQRLGLARLSPDQWAELDAAVGGYTRGEATVAVQQAVKQVERKTEAKVQEAEQKARLAEKKVEVVAESAVSEYRKKQEPGMIARALEAFKEKQEEGLPGRFTARVVGPFRGWSGGTYFPLANGQVWRQVGSESNEQPLVQDAEVEIYQSKNGYWRLRYGGAWITVKRLQ